MTSRRPMNIPGPKEWSTMYDSAPYMVPDQQSDSKEEDAQSRAAYTAIYGTYCMGEDHDGDPDQGKHYLNMKVSAAVHTVPDCDVMVLIRTEADGYAVKLLLDQVRAWLKLHGQNLPRHVYLGDEQSLF